MAIPDAALTYVHTKNRYPLPPNQELGRYVESGSGETPLEVDERSVELPGETPYPSTQPKDPGCFSSS